MKKNGATTCNAEGRADSISTHQMKLLKEWINVNITPRKTPLKDHTSYSLKHIFTRDTGVYVTNDQFKEAMLQCGYYPVDSKTKNWVYCISKKSKAFKNTAL